jgi:hypothetical protein
MSEPATGWETLTRPEGAACANHPDVTARVTCSRCGTYACDACVFSWIPQKEICRSCAAGGLGEPIPWERRREIGWWKAFWQTTKLASREPVKFFRTPPTEQGLWWPVLYGALAYTVGQVVLNLGMAIALMIGGGVTAIAMPEEPAIGLVFLGYGAFFGVFGVLMTLVQAPMYGFVGIMIAAGAAHGMLSLMKKNTGTFEDTVRAVAYANAPYVWSWIPGCGMFIGWIWMIICETIGVRETHRIKTDRAVLAVVLYRALIFVLMVGGYVALILVMVAAERTR